MNIYTFVRSLSIIAACVDSVVAVHDQSIYYMLLAIFNVLLALYWQNEEKNKS